MFVHCRILWYVRRARCFAEEAARDRQRIAAHGHTQFMDWMLNRLKEGYALVRNPMCRTQVSRVALGAGAVDCLAFWTKDPTPLLAQAARLESAAPAPYFVQFTLNAYGADVEAGLPRKADFVETFRELARLLGPERVVWRYSPILLGGSGGRYTEGHHLRYFETFARKLEGSTRACRLSFLDVYPKIAPRMRALGLFGVPEGRKAALALRLAEIGAAHGMEVGGCGDAALAQAGLAGAGCIDAALVARVAGVDTPTLARRRRRGRAAARRAWTSEPTIRVPTAACTAMRTRARDGRAWGGGRRARTAIRGRGATATAGQADVRRRAVRGPCRRGTAHPGARALRSDRADALRRPAAGRRRDRARHAAAAEGHAAAVLTRREAARSAGPPAGAGQGGGWMRLLAQVAHVLAGVAVGHVAVRRQRPPGRSRDRAPRSCPA